MTPLVAWLLCFLPALSAQTLTGAVDIHIHPDPDSAPRSIDALALAKLARERGLRAIVLKNHFESTAGLAWLARQYAPGIEVFGGIALNLPVGGLNPAAIEHMARMKGGYGRIVWMPTFDAENQVRRDKAARPFVPISRNGQLLPETLKALDLIARHKLVLATGHSSADENLLLVREARARGIDRIVLTHATVPPVSMNLKEMKAATAQGAFAEFCYNALVGPNPGASIEDYARTIRGLGFEHCILTSDLGQAANPLPPDGLLSFLQALQREGFTQAEIDRMVKTNPARLLGLE